MDESLADVIKEGRASYRQLLAGKHLRPAQLALTVLVVALDTEWATNALLDEGKQSRWEMANGTS